MRRRKTSHQPNFKAARAVVLGQDGVGKSGILLALVIYPRERAIQEHITRKG